MKVENSWYGHKESCPWYRWPDGWKFGECAVCTSCMPELVPACPICGTAATLKATSDGWRWFNFGHLCPECIVRIQAAGPWPERRAHANEARVQLLLERYPDLVVERRESKRGTGLDGVIAGRQVQIVLRRAPRQNGRERFNYRVELRRALQQVSTEDLKLPEEFLVRTGALQPTIHRDERRWLRMCFQHLGKLDVLTALDGLIATAEALDPDPVRRDPDPNDDAQEAGEDPRRSR